MIVEETPRNKDLIHLSPTAVEIGRMSVQEGLTLKEICESFPRLSRATVRRYIGEAYRLMGKYPPRTDRARNTGPVKPLSPLHHKVGRAIGAQRMKMNLTPLEFCQQTELGTLVSLVSLEAGTRDYTLTDLIKIAKLRGQPLDEFIKEKMYQ